MEHLSVRVCSQDMTDDASSHSGPVADERPELLILCGALGLVGGIAMVVGVVILQTITPDHDPIKNTISDLSRGDLAIWMDMFWYANAAGLVALALGSAHLHLGRWAWSAGTIALALISMDVVMLTLWDEFGTTSDAEALSVHTRLAMVLFPLFLAGPLLMAGAIARVGQVYRWLFISSAGLWAVFALVYFYGPDPVDGLMERIAGACTLLWTLPLSWIFLKRGLRRN